MHRYLFSFIISAFAYLLIVAIIFYQFNQDDYSANRVQKDKAKCIQFSIVAPAKVEKEKEKPKPKVKPKPKKKKKQEIKPKPVVKPKPVIKPKPITELETVVEEPITKEIVEVAQTQTVSNVQPQINKNIRKAKQRKFIEHLIKRISANKSYPNMARRRHIEGVVDVKFKILSNGYVEDIHVISGRSIFKKGTIQAIQRSFPIEVDSALFDFPEMFRVKIAYILK
ncbi:MAG: energy transducer TonB [Sulfurimonas sp.]|nr:energy transducer TonB [Sulfurimonas sp.]